MEKAEKHYEYDVCFSFAGEDREYVEVVADSARSKGIRVFYDMYEEVDLWGKDLYEHLDDIYKNSAKYCVLFASENYAKKLWTEKGTEDIFYDHHRSCLKNVSSIPLFLLIPFNAFKKLFNICQS